MIQFQHDIVVIDQKVGFENLAVELNRLKNQEGYDLMSMHASWSHHAPQVVPVWVCVMRRPVRPAIVTPGQESILTPSGS